MYLGRENCLVLSDLGMFQSGGAFSLFSLIHLGLIWLLLNYRELGDSSEFLFTTVKIFELVLKSDNLQNNTVGRWVPMVHYKFLWVS